LSWRRDEAILVHQYQTMPCLKMEKD